MNIFLNYSLNQPYRYGGNADRSPRFGKSSAGADSGALGGVMIGVRYAGSNASSAPVSKYAPTQHAEFETAGQLRRKLRRSESAQEAVVTVIDQEATDRNKKSASAEDNAEPKVKRIVNVQSLSASSADRMSALAELTDTRDDEEDLLEEKFQYNAQEVSAQIQRAKTSNSAGQAALKATRKVMELKRKLAAGGDDTQEIQLALTHAKQIERVAKKKKRHLQLEELIIATQNRDDRLREEEESRSSISPWDARDISEEEVTDALSEMDRQQSEEFAAVAEAKRSEQPEEELSPDELVASIDALLEKVSGKEQQMLEDTLEQLEMTEVIDLHMSKEDLKMLQIKHRNSERRDIVRADSDYLKAEFAHIQRKGVVLPAFARGGQAMPAAYLSGMIFQGTAVDRSALPAYPVSSAAGGVNLNVQV